MRYTLEVCADSVASVIEAQKGGATRIELCSNLIIGGTTPGKSFFEEVRRYSNLPVRILVRPRFGDFCYDDYEFDIMLKEVQLFRNLGADGIVAGILHPDGSLDMERMKRLREAAGSLAFTLHRVFDVCRDPFETLEQAVLLSADTILTSGMRASAWEGRDLLSRLQTQSNNRIEILAGAGILADQIEPLYHATHIASYHMSGKVSVDSSMNFRREGVPMGLPGFSEYEIWQTSADKVREAANILQKCTS